MTKMDWSKAGHSEPDPARVQRDESKVLTPDEVVISVSPDKKSERSKRKRLKRAPAYWEKQHIKAKERIVTIFAEFADFREERLARIRKRALATPPVKRKKKPKKS